MEITLDVVVAFEKSHENRFSRLRFVQQGLSSNLKPSNLRGVDIVVLHEIVHD